MRSIASTALVINCEGTTSEVNDSEHRMHGLVPGSLSVSSLGPDQLCSKVQANGISAQKADSR